MDGEEIGGQSMTRPIVVGVDGSAEAERALGWAIRVAAAESAPLEIVYCANLAMVGLLDHNQALADGRALLAEAEATSYESVASIEVSGVLRSGDASAALLGASASARLLVVGMQGAGRVPDVLLGSVSYRLAGHADCPVMLVAEDHRPPDELKGAVIVVGLSESESGRQALDFALERAEEWGARIIAVRALEDVDDSSTFTELTEVVARHHAGVDVTVEIANSSATDALRDAGTRADLIVVGSERGSIHRLTRIGQVTGAMLHHPPCPIVIVGPEIESNERLT